MSTNVKKFKIFMASPDDLYEEREMFGKVIEAINRSRGDTEGFHLEPIIWEKYAYPEADNPQAIVNKILGDAALVVVAFWNKFGAPTKEFPSGTMEEFSKAFEKRKMTGKPSIKIYFRQPEPSKVLPQIEELQKILEFKQSIKDKALYKEYTGAQGFKDLLQEHINAWLSSDIIFVQQAASDVTNAIKIEPVSDVRSLLKDYFVEVEKKYEGFKKPSIYFGLTQLDHLVGGLDEHNLILVAGEESTGKTTLLITVANSVSSLDKTILFISPRLHKKEIVERLICNSGGVALSRLKRGELRQEDWPGMAIAAGRLSEQSIYIDDNYSISTDHLRNVIAQEIFSHAVQLVIIDGVNYISDEASKLGQILRMISREFQIPVIGSVHIGPAYLRLQNLSRDKRPTLRDLDKFTDLRSEADIIIFMHRDTDTIYHNEIIIGKNKDGPLGVIKVRLLPQLCKFEEIEAE